MRRIIFKSNKKASSDPGQYGSAYFLINFFLLELFVFVFWFLGHA
jgi:hypothetical protein